MKRAAEIEPNPAEPKNPPGHVAREKAGQEDGPGEAAHSKPNRAEPDTSLLCHVDSDSTVTGGPALGFLLTTASSEVVGRLHGVVFQARIQLIRSPHPAQVVIEKLTP